MSHPSDTELAILKSLWSRSPRSARDIHEDAGAALGWTLSSTRTTLARMVGKGLLVESRDGGARTYAPAHTKARTMAGLMRRFARRVLELDGPVPTSAFTGSAVLDADELAEIDAILSELDKSGDEA